MANRRRDVMICFRVTEAEKQMIRQRMAAIDSTNMEAFLRKMALDGYLVNLKLPELTEMISLLRRSSNNLNQLTRRIHETGHLYDSEITELGQSFDRLWECAQKILRALSKIR